MANEFTYLGKNLNFDKRIDRRSGRAVFLWIRVWKKKPDIKTKVSVYNACVLTTLLYGSKSTREIRLKIFQVCFFWGSWFGFHGRAGHWKQLWFLDFDYQLCSQCFVNADCPDWDMFDKWMTEESQNIFCMEW